MDDWIARGIVTREIVTEHGRDKLRLRIDRKALAAYEVQPGEHVRPLAAFWLFSVRQRLEADEEVAKAAWCVSCGAGCTDRRGHVARVRQWCEGCVKLRHRPGYRRCAAADCLTLFWSARSNQLFCNDACTEAERRRR